MAASSSVFLAAVGVATEVGRAFGRRRSNRVLVVALIHELASRLSRTEPIVKIARVIIETLAGAGVESVEVRADARRVPHAQIVGSIVQLSVFEAFLDAETRLAAQNRLQVVVLANSVLLAIHTTSPLLVSHYLVHLYILL